MPSFAEALAAHTALVSSIAKHLNDEDQPSDCSPGPYQQASDPCAIPIVHNTTVPFVYDEYISWSQNDQYLDFEGAEEKQGLN